MQRRLFDITFTNRADMEAVKQSGLAVAAEDGLTVTIAVQGNYERLVAALSGKGIANLDVRTEKLEDFFMHFYDRKAGMAG